MKMILTVMVLAIGGAAFAASGTPNVPVKTGVARTIDSSGNPIQVANDKPWNVFAIEFQTAPVQVIDERGLAPKIGILGKICMESSIAATTTADVAVIWDTLAVAGMTLAGTGHRIAPPFQRASGSAACTDIGAKFTSGLGIMQNLATGSSYIYWK